MHLQFWRIVRTLSGLSCVTAYVDCACSATLLVFYPAANSPRGLLRRSRWKTLVKFFMDIYTVLVLGVYLGLVFEGSSGAAQSVLLFWVFNKFLSLLDAFHELRSIFAHWTGAFTTMPTPLEVAAAGPECQICLGSMQRPMRLLDCMHIFCEDCIEKSKAYNDACPLCHPNIVVDTLKKIGIAKKLYF